MVRNHFGMLDSLIQYCDSSDGGRCHSSNEQHQWRGLHCHVNATAEGPTVGGEEVSTGQHWGVRNIRRDWEGHFLAGEDKGRNGGRIRQGRICQGSGSPPLDSILHVILGNSTWRFSYANNFAGTGSRRPIEKAGALLPFLSGDLQLACIQYRIQVWTFSAATPLLARTGPEILYLPLLYHCFRLLTFVILILWACDNSLGL